MRRSRFLASILRSRVRSRALACVDPARSRRSRALASIPHTRIYPAQMTVWALHAAQLRAVNLPWQLLRRKATEMNVALSAIVALWGALLSDLLADFRLAIFRLRQVRIPMQLVMEPVASQLERAQLSLSMLHCGPWSKAKLSPWVVLELHAQICCVRRLSFACLPTERAIIKAAAHLSLLLQAKIELAVSKGSRTAVLKQQRAAAARRRAPAAPAADVLLPENEAEVGDMAGTQPALSRPIPPYPVLSL